MSRNASRQGASRHSFAERGHDLYETPACATQALIRTGELERFRTGAIWEPAAGRGAISAILRSGGFVVVSEDLIAYDNCLEPVNAGLDFLLSGKSAWPQAIVTNPPYKLADKFIRHGLSLDLPVIVLLRLMAIEGAGRSDLMDKHCVRIWAGKERLPFMHRDGWTGPRYSNSGAPFAWFVFEPSERTGPIELRRISWKGDSR